MYVCALRINSLNGRVLRTNLCLRLLATIACSITERGAFNAGFLVQCIGQILHLSAGSTYTQAFMKKYCLAIAE
jgi:hypothetical protein